MRLLNCFTLVIEEFIDQVPRYVILSHRWGKEEVTFADMNGEKSTYDKKEGYSKILSTCQQARRDGFQYAWIDTCCIDKSSSAELSEAINSMFRWYEQADKCYAYLSDVSKSHLRTSFPRSEWFTRGWTLQELLAPSNLSFFDQNWNDLGTKSDHASWISEITTIGISALRGATDKTSATSSFHAFCVAQKFSWAASRHTTRPEDEAYCLLGIFQINMPLLYGEGRKAFTRLQEEIIRNHGDQSIFAWGLYPVLLQAQGILPDNVLNYNGLPFHDCSLLADSPRAFQKCANLQCTNSQSPFSMTNVGLQVRLPLLMVFAEGPHADPRRRQINKIWFGLLNCHTGPDDEVLGILLQQVGNETSSRMQMKRIGMIRDRESFPSVVLGPRAAIRAEAHDVTVRGSQDMENRQTRSQPLCHIIIDESNEFQEANYHIWKVQWESRHFGSLYKDASNQRWDQKAMLLTITSANIADGLLSLEFRSKDDCVEQVFTIFARGTTTTQPLQGSVFSDHEKWQIFLNMRPSQELNGGQDHENGRVVPVGSVFDYLNVTVASRYQKVHHWEIFEFSVDTGTSLQQDHSPGSYTSEDGG